MNDGTVASIPLIDGGRWAVSREFVALHSWAYPGVDLVVEARKAASWSEANPKRRKTRAGVERFLILWWARVHDKAKGRPAVDPAVIADDRAKRAAWKNPRRAVGWPDPPWLRPEKS